MSSSTSSSSNRSLRAVAIVLAAVLLGAEAVTRLVLFPMSEDFSRFAAYPEKADNLQAGDRPRLAFVGNSATEEGIDVKLLGSTLQSQGLQKPHVELFLADDSRMNTWRSMMQEYFWRRGVAPDVIVVTFFGNGLSDGYQLDIGRLAQFFTRVPDWPELFRTELTSTEQRVNFVLSSVSAFYAARERIKDRILAMVVPDYKRFATTLHKLNRRPAAAPDAAPTSTYRGLESVLAAASRHGSRMVFVAYPMPGKTFEVPAAARDLMTSYGADFIDMQQNVRLSPEQYADSIHLNADGRLVYTRRFAEVLAPLLARQLTAPQAATDVAETASR